MARGDCAADALRFATRIRCAHACIRIATASFETTDQLDVALSRGRRDAVVLVWLGANETASVVRRVSDLLARRARAGVLVTGQASRLSEELRDCGVLAVQDTVAPDELGAAVWGLWASQPALIALASEQRVSHVAMDRMRMEVEQLHIELETAAVLQRDFMPRSAPDVPGLEVGWLFRPASYVSGDIYDAVVCPDGTLAFFLADAVGHGVSAALLTIAVSRALRDPALQASVARDGVPGKPFSPGAALAELNRDICTRWRNSRWFVTAICGRYDPATHVVTLASAGHPHPLLCGPGTDRDAAEAMFKDFGGPLLGVFEEAPFDEIELFIDEGQTLLLYTDGFELAFAEPDSTVGPGHQACKAPVGRRYLETLVRVGTDAAETDSLAAGIDVLTKRIDNESGSLHQDDDLTVLGIRRRNRLRARRAA